MYLALYLTTPPGMIIIIILWEVILWKLPCLAFTKYVSGIQMRSITVLLRNMVLLSPWSSRSSVHSCRKKMSNKKSLLQQQQQSQKVQSKLDYPDFFSGRNFLVMNTFKSLNYPRSLVSQIPVGRHRWWGNEPTPSPPPLLPLFPRRTKRAAKIALIC